MVGTFEALSDDTRRRILVHLLELDDESNVGQLVEALEMSQPTISKHLKVLRDSGLVTVREEGQRRFYRLDPKGFADAVTWITRFAPVVAPTPEVGRAGDEGFKSTRAAADRIGSPQPSASPWVRTFGGKVAQADIWVRRAVVTVRTHAIDPVRKRLKRH